ncbi:MAG TPA: HEAT repeat domain-containing protein, partial [Candidatus Saccharimonadales bacterium]|nr:HEAT repeat domain-containing protein [Candidatus Saccharimonadales bacterium]
DSTRRPVLDVLHVFKGEWSRPTVTIVPFRRESALDRPWLHPAVFVKGREYILFLLPWHAPSGEDDFLHPDARRDADGDGDEALFRILNADQGVLDLPAEGSEAVTGALETFNEILGLRQYDQQSKALRGLLRATNPYLAEAGLEEVARFGLAQDEDREPLLALLSSPRADFRQSAAEILGQMGEGARREGRSLPDSERIRDRLVAAAMKDRVPEVRAEAARSLGRFGDPSVREVLRKMSREDPDQEVRYRAEIALAEMEGALGKTPPP